MAKIQNEKKDKNKLFTMIKWKKPVNNVIDHMIILDHMIFLTAFSNEIIE